MKIIGSHSLFANRIGLLKRLLSLTLLILVLGGCAEKTSEEYLQEAQQFIAAGDNQAAVVALKNAVQKAPRVAEPRFELGKIYLQLKNYESAEKELSRALELGYPANKVLPMLSEALQRSGANVALSEIEISQQDLTPAESLEIGFRKLQSMVQLDQTLKAQNLINELLALDSNTVYRGLVEGYQLVLDKKFPEALEIAETMHARAPLNRDVLNFTARLYVINNDPSTAARIYENYIKVAPDDLETKFSLANMLVEQRETERAEKYIDELLALNDTNPLLNQLKGIVRAADEDYQNAKLYAEKAINAGRSDPVLRLIAGLASYQTEAFEDAIGHLSLIATLLPDNHPGLRILAASQLQVNMGDEAGEVLSRVDDISEDDALLFSRAGYALIQAGNTNAAKEIIEQADKISESSDDLTRLGVLKLSLNNIEGIVDLESAVEKAPESATAKTTLASAYLGTNQFDKALQLAAQWQKDEADSADGYLLEAEVMQRQQEYVKAQQVLDKARQIEPENTAILTAEMRLALRVEDFSKALEKTQQILNKNEANLPALASFFALKNQAGKSQEGIDRIRVVADKYPENTNLALLLARVTLSMDQSEASLEALKDIESDRAAPLMFWPMKGLALLRLNKIDEAETHYKTWQKIYPNQENAVMGHLLILDGKREFAKGAQLASEFLGRKENTQIEMMQSYFYIMSNDIEDAKRVFKKIDDKFKAIPFLRGVKARIAMAEKRPQDAVADAEVAYDANKNTNNLLLYVNALDLTKQADKSFQLLQSHVEQNSNDLGAKMLLADKQLTRDSDAAIATYRDILEKAPNNAIVLNNLAYLRMEDGELEEAESLALRAYDIRPDSAAIADTYAQVLIKQNKLDEAIQAYNRVVDKNMKNEEILLNYVEALLLNDNTLIAKRRIKDMTFTLPESQTRLKALKTKYKL